MPLPSRCRYSGQSRWATGELHGTGPYQWCRYVTFFGRRAVEPRSTGATMRAALEQRWGLSKRKTLQIVCFQSGRARSIDGAPVEPGRSHRDAQAAGAVSGFLTAFGQHAPKRNAWPHCSAVIPPMSTPAQIESRADILAAAHGSLGRAPCGVELPLRPSWRALIGWRTRSPLVRIESGIATHHGKGLCGSSLFLKCGSAFNGSNTFRLVLQPYSHRFSK